jgi:DNA invertase Pin-like site-specific DNA recombinase
MIAKPVKPKRVAIYLRVSTAEQNTRNQRRELKAGEKAERAPKRTVSRQGRSLPACLIS